MNLDSITTIVSSVPFDWLLVAAIVVLLAFDSLRSGANRAITISLSFPVAFYLFVAIPHTKYLASFSAQWNSPLLQLALFGVLLLAAYLMLGRIISAYGRGDVTLPQSIISGLAATAIAVAFWLQIPSLQSIWHFGPQIQAVFGEAYKFWWLIGSYIALAFVRR